MDNPAENSQTVTGPKGIGGWLILNAIGLILGPFFQAYHAGHLIFIFVGPNWERLTNPDSPAYNVFWKPALIYEFVSHLFFLCYVIAALILFFSHSRYFPKLAIILFLLYFVYGVTDLWLCNHIPFIVQHPKVIQKEELGIVRSVLVCLIWIPYYCVSRRVKNTFVE